MSIDGVGEGSARDSGPEIPEEERREILARIDDAIEKNLRSLSRESDDGAKRRFKAKKHGGLFPVLVNVFAVLLLVGGFFALRSLQTEADALAREGARGLTELERSLIDAIRAEVGALLAGKDAEIAAVSAALSDVDARLEALDALEGEPSELASEERARLLALRDGLAAELAEARGARGRVLGEARERETAVLARLDGRARAFDGGAGATGVEASPAATPGLADARWELARLSEERGATARAETQVAGLFAAVQRQVAAGDFDGAAGSLEGLRATLGTPGLCGLGDARTRRELYAMATGALETLLVSANADGAREILRLQRELDGAKRTAGDLAARDAEAALAVARLEGSVASLQAANAALSSRVGALQTENADMAARMEGLWSENAALAARLAAMGERLAEAEAGGLPTAYAPEPAQIAEPPPEADPNGDVIRELRERNASQERYIAALNTQLAQIRQVLDVLTW